MNQSWRNFIVSTLCVLFVGFFTSETRAQESAPPNLNERRFFDFKDASVELNVWSQYIFSNGFVAHDEPVVQGNFHLDLEGGLYMNLWGSLALSSRGDSPNFGDEVDYKVGYITDLGGMSLDLSASYFDIGTIFGETRQDAVQIAVEFSKKFEIDGAKHTIAPYFRTEVVFGLDGQNVGEFYLHGGVRHYIEIWENFSFNQHITGVYDSGGFGFESGFILGYGAGFTWQATSSIAVDVVKFKATIPIDLNDRDPEMAIGAGISIAF